jgi:transposase
LKAPAANTRDKHMNPGSTRYDKLAASYLTFVQLAAIKMWL